ncbi:hypothetical protein [Alteromonas sp. ASW11-130]|uniref:hypothetical protein n=1 Tax=Alteromonas sp. ASW11-130 TaxID=3015775 RepID=UPI0022423E79|nr:hypothetical protein [Alteromonas sp. ASW11-130]MCW8090618.1 hypothetical protein [Alteromonas sp. ASW11-130]
MLREQKELIEELKTLIESHVADFTAFEREGRVIDANGRVFEMEMLPILENRDYDFIGVVGPDNKDMPYAYDDNSYLIFLL